MRKGNIEQCLVTWGKLQTFLFTRLIAGQFRRCGSGTRISPPFRFANLSRISLGENVMIHRDCWIHVLAIPGGDQNSGEIVIQSNAGIGMGATISAIRRILIGEHVILARNVYISDHRHAFEDMNVPIALQGIAKVAEVEIGASTWIGQNACVLPGVRIGKHCVVGSNSVVTHDLPDFCVAAGVPAKVIKRYNEGTRRWEKVSSTSE
jgi:acetyltransferase-like isoleucine patch superfamily enzyme